MPVVGAVLPRQADMPPIRRLLDADALGEEPAEVVIHDFDYICPHTAAQIHMGLGTLLQGEPLGVMEPKPRGDPVRFLACKNSLASVPLCSYTPLHFLTLSAAGPSALHRCFRLSPKYSPGTALQREARKSSLSNYTGRLQESQEGFCFSARTNAGRST